MGGGVHVRDLLTGCAGLELEPADEFMAALKRRHTEVFKEFRFVPWLDDALHAYSELEGIPLALIPGATRTACPSWPKPSARRTGSPRLRRRAEALRSLEAAWRGTDGSRRRARARPGRTPKLMLTSPS